MADGEVIELRAGGARAAVVPELGGGLAELWADGAPALRPWSGAIADGPFALACNLLAPFSNRISGGFEFEGARFELEANVEGEPFPLHGDAFARPWRLVDRAADRLDLALDEGAFGAFRYAARIRYALAPNALRMRLSLRNLGPRLPFGYGFHPWFPRDAATRIAFSAQEAWLEDERHLPRARVAIEDAPELDFAEPRALPEGWINTGFACWSGEARIEQGAGARSCRLRSDLGHAIVFSPDAGCGFLCFEPVSHPVDAHNLPGQPGLRPLDRGERTEASVTIEW